MKKTAIKNFAVWARRKLISEITYKAGLIGISEKGIQQPLEMSTDNIQFFDIGTEKPTEIVNQEIKQRGALIKRIREKESTSDYTTAFQFIIEEVAYTWFNRLIAIRFMEVNDYLPSRVKVLSSEDSRKIEPDMVTSPFDTDMEFSSFEREKIIQLKEESKSDELFQMLFIKQCNKLNEILPELFEKTQDYTELLFNMSFTDQDGIIRRLMNEISEDDFEEKVEIIGWLYQYYISEYHDEVVNVIGRKAIKKDDIPAATQLFTTDWVVRYMVENSLGAYWCERNPKSRLPSKLNHLIKIQISEKEKINENTPLEELTFFDPCMGSGHILVYAFDVFMDIYRECGYVDRDAAQEIVKNNLYGIDIDQRAYQLAYFAIMMKARSYDRRFFSRNIHPNISAIYETNSIKEFYFEGITADVNKNLIGEYLVEVYKNAKEIGSLLKVKEHNYSDFLEYLNKCYSTGEITLDSYKWFNIVLPLMEKVTKQAMIMSKQYSIVSTNPPYMNKMEGELKKFIIKNYKSFSGDLFSAFMVKNFDYCKLDGYSSFMTPNVWMFNKIYEKLREFIIENKSIASLVQMAKGAFYTEATVDVCAFVLKNNRLDENGTFIRLEEFKGGMEIQEEKFLEVINNNSFKNVFIANKNDFSKIPGTPIVYWSSHAVRSAFENKLLNDYCDLRQGLATADDNRFLRLWHEVELEKIGFDFSSSDIAAESGKKWFPCNKGGKFRRWYGNNDYLVNWENNGSELRAFERSVIRNPNYYFLEGVTWSTISSGKAAFRRYYPGFIFNNKGSGIFSNGVLSHEYIIALLNSNLVGKLLEMLSPTVGFELGYISKIPVLKPDLDNYTKVEELSRQCIKYARDDWNSFETSWEFESHPLLEGNSIKLAYERWEILCKDRFEKTKENEIEINRILVELYELTDEVSNDVKNKEISVRTEDINRDIKGLISYAVGCMFGRYSIDRKGLVFAGNDWDDNKYVSFSPDLDNCIPITDEEYFEDDIVGRFVEFVKVVYGAETLEENLDFIANALGNKGNTSRTIIRNYFIKDFYKDHVKTYKKRPIYWLYDSGKQNGFKALIYMHRYTADTTGSVRVDYLHRMQKIYMSEIDRMQDMAQNSTNAREAAQAEKRKEKLVKQLKETKEYDEKIAHLALSRIEIDLDHGVKVNYEKVQTSQDGKKLNILGKI